MKHVKTYGMVIHLEKHKIYALMIIFQLKKAIKSATHFRTHPNWVFIYIYISHTIRNGLVPKSYSDFLNLPWAMDVWRYDLKKFSGGFQKKGSEMAGLI